MITWLTPAMIVGSASGSCARHSVRRGWVPNASAASTSSASTCRMPSSVRRTAGGIANTMVATMPGTGPTPKKKMPGIRQTIAGMVCMKSSTGRIAPPTVRLRTAQSRWRTA